MKHLTVKGFGFRVEGRNPRLTAPMCSHAILAAAMN